VPAESFEIAYAAHTASCTFLLDAEGICRRIVVVPSKRRDTSKNASRCVGAQYVASLDPSAPGCLVEMPRVGAAMLFARVDERGRVSLVRTAVVTHFEQKRPDQHDPFESVSVKTSAPEIPPAVPRAPKTQRLPDPDYDDGASERTQRIQALRPEDLARFHFGDAEPDLEPDLKTAEYQSQPSSQPERAPSKIPSSAAPTLRKPPRFEPSADELDDDPYAERARAAEDGAPRGMLPRRNEPVSVPGKRRSDPRQPRAQAWQGEPKVASRRRDR
jgi:hypothetical protein